MSDQPDMFGGGGRGGSLARDYLEPPFSVLDGRSGRWRSRRRRWEERIGEAPRPTYEGASHNNADAHSNTARLGGREGPSRFDPYLAEMLIRSYSAPGDLVLDPFCGDVTRGAVADMCGRVYRGYDLSRAQIHANRGAARALGLDRAQYGVRDARDTYRDDARFDLVLTCPPYWRLEKYSDDPRDLSRGSFAAWRGALGLVASGCHDVVADNRFLCIVLGGCREFDGGYYRNLKSLSSYAVVDFERVGWALHNEVSLLTPIGTAAARARNQWVPSRKVVAVHQTVLVFVKGDAFAATRRLGVVEGV